MNACVYIDAHGTKVGHSSNRLTLKPTEGAVVEIPLQQIEQVIVLGHTHFSHDAIAALLKNGIPVVFSSLRGGYRGTLSAGHGRQIHRRLQQYDAMRCPVRRLGAARALVQAKLRGQARLLRQWQLPIAQDIPRALQASNHCQTLDQLRGHEGIAARSFFSGLRTHLADSGFEFTQRRQHPAPDPVNALLSLIYTLLLNEAAVGTAACGLDDAGGFLHDATDGRSTVLMDLIEPMRPLADRFCARLLKQKLQPDDFRYEEGRCLLCDGNRGQVYKAWEALLQTQTTWQHEQTTWRRLIHLQARTIGRWLDAGATERLRFWYLDAP